jgi:hypothetical protein
MRRVGIVFGLWRAYARTSFKKGGVRYGHASKTKTCDPVKVDPKHYTVEFENDKVRVLRIKYGPGEKSVMHAHPALVAVFSPTARSVSPSRTGKKKTSPPRPGRFHLALLAKQWQRRDCQ